MMGQNSLYQNRHGLWARGCCFFSLLALVFSLKAKAADEVPQGFSYTSQFYNSSGTAPLTDTINLLFDIYDPNADCLLYEELQSNIDLSTTNGAVATQVGSFVGSSARTSNDPGLSMAAIFSNSATIINSKSVCSYTPAAGDSRRLRVTLTDHSTGIPTTLSPDLTFTVVPTALVAQTLQGMAASSFIQSSAGVSGQGNVSLSTLMTLTGGGDASSLHNHDSLYVKLSANSSQNLGTSIQTGSIGIGVTASSADIELGGNVGRTIQVDQTTVSGGAGNSLSLVAGAAASGSSNQNGGNLVLASGASSGAAGSQIVFETSGNTYPGNGVNPSSPQMILDSNGRLGIGSLTPAAQLDVVAGSAITPGIAVHGTNNQYSNLLEFRNNSNSVLSYFDSSGYLTLPGVPIASNQAVTKAYVDAKLAATSTTSFSDSTVTSINALSNISTAGGIIIDSGQIADIADVGGDPLGASLQFGGEVSGEYIFSNQAPGSSNRYGLSFATSSVTQMSITALGNVGIGTSSPQAVLDVSGYYDTLRLSTTNVLGSTQILLNGFGRQFALGVGNFANPNGTANEFFLTDSTSGVVRMLIDTNGNVGIGSMTPGAVLDVAGPGQFSGVLVANGGVTIPSGQTLTLAPGSTLISAGLPVGFASLSTDGAVNGSSVTATGTLSGGSVVASGTISGNSLNASGVVSAGSATVGSLSSSGIATVGSLSSSGSATLGSLTSFGPVNLGSTLSVSGTTDFLGDVGLGSATPGATLDIVGTENISGLLTANGGITSPGSLSTSALIVDTNGITSNGIITSSGLINANGGLTVASGQTLILSPGSALSSATIDATFASLSTGAITSSGPVTSNGAISANGGLTVPSGQTLTLASGSVLSSAGLSVTVGSLSTSGILNTGSTLNVSGSATVGSLSTAGAANVGSLTAAGGGSFNTLTSTGLTTAGSFLTSGSATVGSLSSSGSATVGSLSSSGLATVGSLISSGSASVGSLSSSGPVNFGSTLNVSGVTDHLANVGIGSATPGANLDVVGTVRVSGLLTANGGLTVASGQTLTLSPGSTLSSATINATFASLSTPGNLSVGNNILGSVGNFNTLTSTNLTTTFITAGAATLVSLSSSGNATVGSLSSLGPVNIASSLTTTGVTDFLGNVGIGSATPGANLDVVGTARVSGLFTANGGVVSNGTLSTSGVITDSNGISSSGVITSSGLINANGGLTVASGQTLTLSPGSSLSSSTIAATFASLSTTGALNIGGVSNFYGITNHLANVGIGSATPAYNLDVVGNGRFTVTSGSALAVQATATTSYSEMSYIGTGRTFVEGVGNASETHFGVPNKWFLEDGTAGAVRMMIDTAGNVGIGTTTPTYTLHVIGTINASGNVYSGGVRLTSDRRVKEEVQDISDADALKFVSESRPVHFKWKTGDHDYNYGFIAQDLYKQGLKEVVTLIPDSQMKETQDADGFVSPAGLKFTVSYEQLIALLTKALKNFVSKLGILDDKVEKLQKENAAMKAYFCAKDPTAPFCGP